MDNKEKHSGGCACGKVRYYSIGKPVKTGLCHCRYCQLRTGTAFGISVYFNKENIKIESGDLKNIHLLPKMEIALKLIFALIVEQVFFGHFLI